MTQKLSVVIPAYNEGGNVHAIHDALSKILDKQDLLYEIIFVDDGSSDTTNDEIKRLAKAHNRVRLVGLSKNFGKEIATTAGLHKASGDAVIMIDADGQHPPELIPEFVKAWRAGVKVVIGVRDDYASEGVIKRYGSKVFYGLFNHFSEVKLIPASTDFRLIDAEVLSAFKKLEEQNRITRGLIDWLGYERSYIHFKAQERLSGSATYSSKKLVGLALNSFVSLSFAPLYMFGYLGILITMISLLVGLFVIVEQYLLNDPIGLNISGSASLSLLVLFLVGLLLTSQGIMSLYISKIYSEAKRRPLFIIDESKSKLS